MKCHRTEELTADYLAGHLEAAAAAELQAHARECAACRESLQTAREMWTRLGALPECQPSPALRLRVQDIIEAYRQGMSRSPTSAARTSGLVEWLAGWWPRRPAFQFALVALAFASGIMAQAWRNPDARPEAAVANLREEVNNLRQLVTVTLLQQPSASERLEGVSYSYRVNPQDEKVLAALLQALESDPNVNVRVATVDALRQFAPSVAVRTGLLRSLAKESSPLVQLELIDLLVQLREKETIPILEKIRKDTDFDPAVREQAEKGLRQLT
jgi:hypothetical protein